MTVSGANFMPLFPFHGLAVIQAVVAVRNSGLSCTQNNVWNINTGKSRRSTNVLWENLTKTKNNFQNLRISKYQNIYVRHDVTFPVL